MLPLATRYFGIIHHTKGILTVRKNLAGTIINLIHPKREKTDNNNQNLSSLFQPIPVTANPDDINVGAELTTSIKKTDLLKILNFFVQKKEVKTLATEYGLDKYLWQEAFNSFRRYCMETESLPVDLHIVISDVLQGAGHVTDIFPYFMRHAKEIYPHIDCLDDLKKISDLRTPPNWYNPKN